jgi:20S proteasome alpha/beta subunit
VCKDLDNMYLREVRENTGNTYFAKNYASFLANKFYAKRNKQDPLWLDGLVAGVHGDERYLAWVDMYGNWLEQDYICTGFARHICGEIIEPHWNPECDLETAINVCTNVFKVLLARFKGGAKGVVFKVVGKDGIIRDRKTIDIEWHFENYDNKPLII